MREIKFRAWDNYDKRMLQDVGYHPFIIEQYTDYKPTENGAYLISPKFDNYVLMQYTGLKDKNGKEIYEGDILGLSGFVSHKVGFEDGSFVMIPVDRIQSINWEHYRISHYTHYEVIGNIYENKELLDRK